MKVILNADQIERVLGNLADQIAGTQPSGPAGRISSDNGLAVIGIRSRGEILAQRLADRLSQMLCKPVPCGTLDITLYRDDLNAPHRENQPHVRTTEIGFDIDGKEIILVDDVLYTGRSARAAMDALIDLGRPKAIRLAVLVERAGRELPIQADYCGKKADVHPEQSIQVSLVESDGKDEVVVE
jgi:pyrimidine operon attenuation protein/uracil phosphoribosyltransferase